MMSTGNSPDNNC